jgi:DNA-binding LacI/PurR family transcriptional regulator
MTSSIGDVAARAGVSVATVSRALRGLPNVADSTREKVLRAAAELDYVVNPNASRLAAGRNHTIGVVCPSSTGWYFQNVMAGVQSILERLDFDMLLYTLPDPDSRERFLRVLPFRKRVDGLILIDIPLTDPEQRMLAGLGTPLVSVGEGGSHYPLIKVDNHRGARLATDYLLDLAANDRWSGWAEAMKGRDLEPDERLLAIGDFTMRSGADAMGDLLIRSPGLSAVLCMSDEMAIGALGLLADLGIRVPHDMSVIGFDDQEVSAHIGLTSVRQPMHRLGATAAELLFASLQGDRPTGFPRVLPVSLVPRETTAPFVGVGVGVGTAAARG